jgi:hypothetical protein
MATFASFIDTLPDPNNSTNDYGQPSGTAGPGFKSIKFTSQAPVQVSRTNSGRVITRGIAGHKWSVNITYNPMTRDEFEPVFSFLLQQKGRLNPFYVQLPNQYTARNSDFATHVASNTITNEFALTRGASYMVQDGHHASHSPEPGDMFTITDDTDSLHTKAYRVTRVMTSALYWAGLTGNDIPTDTAERGIYFTPNLQRDVAAAGKTIVYKNPKIRVILKNDIQEYSLGTNNLYTFSLNLEEAQA